MTLCRRRAFSISPPLRLEYRMIGPRPGRGADHRDAARRARLRRAVGRRFPTSSRPRPAPACSSIRAPATASRAPASCRARVDFMHEEALRRAAARARRDRLSARHSARPQRRRLDRGDLCRQRAGSSRARPRADRAAFLHRGHGPRRDPPRAQGASTPAICARSSSAGTPMSIAPSAAGTSRGSIPNFRNWDITEALGYIRVPILIVQGEDDQYGTLRADRGRRSEECYCPVEAAVLPGVAPRAAPRSAGATLDAIADFINRLLRDHHEGERRRQFRGCGLMHYSAYRRSRVACIIIHIGELGHVAMSRRAMADARRASWPTARRGSISRPSRRATATGSSRSTATSRRC